MLDKRTSSILFTILFFAGVLTLAYTARRPLLILIFSILFAYLLEPIVAWFQRQFRGSRTLGIVAAYLILAAALSIFFAVAGPKIVHQGTKLTHELPNLIDNIGSGDIAQQIGARRGWTYETQFQLQELLRAHRAEIGGTVRSAVNRAPAMASSLLWFLLVPLFAVFILKSKKKFAATALALVDNRHDRLFLRGILADLDVMLAAFIRAQLSLASVSIVVYTSILVLTGFPYAFPIAAIAGVLEFIPVVGALTGNVTIMGMAIVTGYRHWLAILIFLIVWRGLQDYVTSPLLMGRGLKLHPFAVILGVLICGDVAGLPGVFLSVPLIASLRIVWRNWEKRRVAIDEVNTERTEIESLAI